MHASDPPYAHNDLKPGNVLFSSKKGDLPVAIVMDFGSAAPARRSIRSRSEALALQVSSSAYVSHENADARESQARACFVLMSQLFCGYASRHASNHMYCNLFDYSIIVDCVLIHHLKFFGSCNWFII